MGYAPIILFVYNRADHFEKTFTALSKCVEAKKSDLFIFSDGPKNEANIEKVNQVRKAVAEVKDKDFFKSVTIFESKVNKGLAQSVISGVTQIINEYGRVIVLEDDCVPSPHFLKFMNDALEFYVEKKHIGAITGFTPPIDFPIDFKNDIFTAYRSCSWSWGTWADRWQGIDWELKQFSQFYKNPQLIKKLNANGNDRFIRLYRQTKGNGSSWSVRFGAHLVKNDMLTVYPKYSYISNIGCDESGVHSKTDDAEKMRVDIRKAIASPILADVLYNNQIGKIMKKHYSGGVVSDIKRFLYTKYIVLKGRLKG